MTTSVALLALTLIGSGPSDAASAISYSEPYCGLYSMYAALNALGFKPGFETINDSRYLSGDVGSTAADLLNLARDQGSTAAFYANLTTADLRDGRHPVVLHTAGLISASGFRHWILFLGWDGDRVKVYDPPGAEYTLSTAELLSQWDGVGIVIGERESRWGIPGVNQEVVWAGLLVVAFGFFASRVPLLARRPGIAILATAMVSAIVWHAGVDYGLMRNRSSLDAVAALHDPRDAPSIAIDEFKRLVGREGVTIVDARTTDAFAMSHVPGAVNIPVTVTHGYLREVLASIPLENQVVVYCKSEDCGWSSMIARLFPSRGYRRVSIFTGGMDAWTKATAGKSRAGGGVATAASRELEAAE